MQVLIGSPERHLLIHGLDYQRRAFPVSTRVAQPLLVSAVRGLAGSGALTSLVMATIRSAGARLIYLLLFSAGSTLGMAALSGLMGNRARRNAWSSRTLSVQAGGQSHGAAPGKNRIAMPH
jgi:hypothetical protein